MVCKRLALYANGTDSERMTTPWYELPDARRAAAEGNYGCVLKLARQAMGFTQIQAGRLAGYSGASISRYETGATRLTDISTLRHLARVFGIPATSLGLSGADPSPPPITMGSVRADPGGGDQLNRREVLTTMLAAVGGVMLLPVPALAEHDITGGLDELLFGSPQTSVPGVKLERLSGMLASAKRDFRACRYRELATRLPVLLRTAEATRDNQGVEGRASAETMISDAYALATEVLTKLHENGAAWATADRAMQAANVADDPRALARAQRLAAIVLRRSAHRAKAQAVVLDSARKFASSTQLSLPGDASFYASMLCTGSYTAALTDHRSAACGLLDDASQVVTEHGGTGFGINDITLYGIGIGIARALGDYGKALDYSRQVRLDLLGTAERHARYWEDTALAWWGRGRPDASFQAMLNAERAAPQEVRYRPWAQQLATQLLSMGPVVGLSGLREFATRAGVR